MFSLAAATVATLLMAGCSSSTSSGPDAQTATVFENGLAFNGYAVNFNKDGHTELELHWTALRTPTDSVVVFVHAVDSAGTIQFQGDHILKNAAGAPATSWTAGEAVSDRFLMIPSGGHTPGPYNLRIGLYTLSGTKILKITQPAHPMPTDGWSGRAILLTGVECK